MNPLFYPALQSEIQTDPTGQGYAAYLAARASLPIANLLTALHGEWTKIVPFVPMSSVLGWAALGVHDKITFGSTNSALPQEVRAICQVALKMFSVGPFLYLRQPALSAAVVAGGSLTPWTYFYLLVGLTPQGNVCKSQEVQATTAGGNASVQLSWSANVPEVACWQIYRGTAAGAENLLLTTINNPATTSWTDSGSVAGTSAMPPTCHADLVGALAGAGVISSSDAQQVLALQNVAPAARSEVLWGDGVLPSDYDVRRAMDW